MAFGRSKKTNRVRVWRTDRFFRMLLLLLVIGVVWWAVKLRTSRSSDGGGTKTGTVQLDSLSEISGIALSRRSPDVLWAHNDSGDSARVYAMGTDGTHLGTFTLSGARAIDYEDMAIGPGPLAGVDYLYVADTGNNDLVRTTVTVYRVPEPALTTEGPPVTERLTGVEALPMRFPDRPHECETLLVDPLNGDLYLVTRDRNSARGGFSQLFRNPAPQKADVKVTLKLVAKFSAPSAIKGGDFSPDGSTILLRAHSVHRPARALQWTWDRKTSLARVFAKPGLEVPTAFEPQGEAIAFAADGLSYYTIGEGIHAPIYRYPVKPPSGP